MAQVVVTIAGRSFRMACGDGEEPHLEALAQQVDARIAELRTSFGEIGDQRLTVMSAISFADELAEMKQRLARQEAELAALRATQQNAGHSNAAMTEALADALESAAARIETVAKSIR